MFKAKSEDRKRNEESRRSALSTSKHLEPLIINAIRPDDQLGENNGQPDVIKKYINSKSYYSHALSVNIIIEKD